MFTNFTKFLNPTHSDEIVNTLKNFYIKPDKLGFVGIFYGFCIYYVFKDYDSYCK